MKGLIIGVLLLIGGSVNAQQLFHVQGNKGFDLGYMYTKHGQAFLGGYVGYLKDNVVLKVRINTESGLIGLTDYQDYNISAGAQYTFGKVTKRGFLNVGGGLYAGFENYKNVEIGIDEGLFDYGVFGGVEIEYFAIERVALFVSIEQIISIKSKLGLLHYKVGGGLRILIN